MPKHLFNASFTPEGVVGVRSEGGTSRREVVSDAVSALGGSLETVVLSTPEEIDRARSKESGFGPPAG